MQIKLKCGCKLIAAQKQFHPTELGAHLPFWTSQLLPTSSSAVACLMLVPPRFGSKLSSQWNTIKGCGYSTFVKRLCTRALLAFCCLPFCCRTRHPSPPKDAARIPVEAKLAWPDAEPSSTFALYFLVSRTGEIHLVIYYKLPSLGHFVIVVHTDWYHRTSFCIFALIYTHIWCFNTFTQNSKRLHSTTVPINRTKQCHIYLVKYWTTGNYCMRHPGGGL